MDRSKGLCNFENENLVLNMSLDFIPHTQNDDGSQVLVTSDSFAIDYSYLLYKWLKW